jgi:predicted type IV restriction endonuclease
MSRTLLLLAGFEVITNGRFWVITEAEKNTHHDQDHRELNQSHYAHPDNRDRRF